MKNEQHALAHECTESPALPHQTKISPFLQFSLSPLVFLNIEKGSTLRRHSQRSARENHAKRDISLLRY